MLASVSTTDPRVPQLQGTALFGATNDETVAFVLAKAPRISVETGHWFFREGERGASIYWLEQGSVAVCMRSGDADVELRIIQHRLFELGRSWDTSTHVPST